MLRGPRVVPHPGRVGILETRRRRLLAGVAGLGAVVATLPLWLGAGATGEGASRCETFAAQSAARAAAVSGSGAPVLVVGDSYSAGLGLDDLTTSWPARLPGEVHVAGFSGSGFSPGASSCGARVAYDRRAPEALARLAADDPAGADDAVVVLEGGLNDVDQPSGEIAAGFERLLAGLEGHRVVVVGPPLAPERAAAVPRVDALLGELARAHGAAYVATSGLDLTYLPDRLHLTPEGHRVFGDHVAAALSAGQPAR